MGDEALIAWLATAGVGFSLMGVFFGRGGMRQLRRGQKRLRPQLVLSHIALAVLGFAAWVAFLATDRLFLAWTGLGLLGLVTLLGSVSFYVWQRRRLGLLRATESSWDLPRGALASEDLPAEQHFPVSVVVLHGVFAVATLVLVLHGTLAATNDARATRPAAKAAPASPPEFARVPEGDASSPPADPPSRPRGVRVARRGRRATVSFRPGAARTRIRQLARRAARRTLGTRMVPGRPARRERAELRLDQRTRFLALTSVRDGRTSKTVVVRLR